MLLDRLVRLVRPQQGDFFGLLERLAGSLAAASAVFGELADARGRECFSDIAGRLRRIEAAADDNCHLIYTTLDRTFVTPIDREDLAALTGRLDDVIDSMEHTAAFTLLFHLDALTEPMRKLVGLQQEAVAEVVRSVGGLRHFRRAGTVSRPTRAVHTLENQGDLVYRAAIGALFANGTEARELVRQGDILYCLEDGLDRCEDAMDKIRSVVVKNE